jgi:aerobic-type carbon monoxide dehydrogenase small subunit (CoxS/CutS family)
MTAAARSFAITVDVNGSAHRVRVDARDTLADLLRDRLGLTGTKIGCGVGECGACTVLLDDSPVVSCLVLAVETDGRRVTTIEDERDPRIEALRQAFVAEAALQCGFCTPGMILAARALPADADDDAVRAGLAGNICRCTGYTAIVRAVRTSTRHRARGRRG